MYIYTNPNPQNALVGDCVVRALSIALNEPWGKIYLDLCAEGMISGDMPSSNAVWIKYLKKRGFTKHIIPDTCPNCYTIADFSKDNPKEIYILGTGDHVVTIMNGDIYDTWDSSDRTPIFYLKRE